MPATAPWSAPTEVARLAAPPTSSSGAAAPGPRSKKLVASDGAADDAFGWSVSLAGDRALVGAPGDDSTRGAAYVFGRSGSAWTEDQKLVANDGAAFDSFGNAVSLAGDRALVGAYWNDDFRGAAYVFVRSASSWTAEQKLVASDGAASRLGNAVSLAGDRALIGAFADEDGRGAAYVFSRTGAWTTEQKLVASDTQADLFAWSVSLAADRALVGAMYNDQLRGAAYVFSLGVENRDAGSADADVDVGQDGGAIEAGPGTGSCMRGDECTSGHCEDGICCDRTCAANERCRAELKLSEEDGVCGPAKAAAPGAPCRFDVQCTSGHCSGADGVCVDADAAPDGGCPSGDVCVSGAEGSDPGDGGGRGCRAGGAPAHSPSAWPGVALVLLLLRPPLRPSVRGHALAWRRCWQPRLQSRGPVANQATQRSTGPPTITCWSRSPGPSAWPSTASARNQTPPTGTARWPAFPDGCVIETPLCLHIRNEPTSLPRRPRTSDRLFERGRQCRRLCGR